MSFTLKDDIKKIFIKSSLAVLCDLFYIARNLTMYSDDLRACMNMEIVSLEKTSLVSAIAEHFKKNIIFPKIAIFSDEEIHVSFEDPSVVANKTIIFIQSTNRPINENLLKVAFTTQELKNAGAHRIIGVLPYFGYSRQEKSDILGKPGHAAIVVKLLEASGINELITVDIHDSKIADFFSIPFDSISVHELIAEHIKKRFASLNSICLVAPDKGAKEYVESVGKLIGLNTLVFSKERYGIDQTRVIGMTGECRGKTAIIIDDIIDTGGTAINVCNELKDMGFERINGYFVHPVFSGNALERIAQSAFDTIFVSNTIPLPVDVHGACIEIFDVSRLITNKLTQVI